ncbi:hypothetical protein QFC22_005675 [Naganishia vaughanmartiniae]|uniref:Uncharacterized protein n=1 Tax=Naganishia vaughanmartiniae TaxID=1424756 RepID=A0ACC2WRW9_9TREE|nr:hypothetical protein QFC22_005675 [Naganishia vaughanmartiniae]
MRMSTWSSSAVKTPLHKQSALHAIHAHKSVFLEWPLGNGLQQAIELAHAAKGNGIRTMIGLQARQDLAILKAKQLLDQHTIGKVLSSTFIGYGGAWGPAVQQRNAYTLDEKNGTTLLTVPFGHFIDAFVYLLGDFESLSAYKTTVIPTSTVIETNEQVDVKTAPDQLTVQGQLLSGALAAVHYRGGNPLPGSQGPVWEIEGEKGLITFKASGTGHIQASSTTIKPASDQTDFLISPILSTAPQQLISPQLYLSGEQVDLPQDKLGNTGRLYEAFAKCDQSGYNDWDHAVQNHRIVDAVERSCKEGRRTSYL